jgi:hypothetical protein
MWLLYKEKADGFKILQARNGREYRLPELPHLSADGFCPETRKVLQFCGFFCHGHTCLPFHDVTTMFANTLAERHEQTLARIKQITRAGVQVERSGNASFMKGYWPAIPN